MAEHAAITQAEMLNVIAWWVELDAEGDCWEEGTYVRAVERDGDRVRIEATDGSRWSVSVHKEA